MSKDELNQKLMDALEDFDHQSYQAAFNDNASLELAKAVSRLMNSFRENIMEYLQ